MEVIFVSPVSVEDVLGSRRAHYWAPDGKHICFARFNDTAVPLIKYPHYGDRTEMYNDITEIAYPKVGLRSRVKLQ